MTIKDVAIKYGRAAGTIRQNVLRGAIKAQKIRTHWLILKEDAKTFYEKESKYFWREERKKKRNKSAL